MLQTLASPRLRYLRGLCVALQLTALWPVNAADAMPPDTFQAVAAHDFAVNPARRRLSFELNFDPSMLAGVWIEYEALGASDPTHLRRVVNGTAYSGGYARYAGDEKHHIRDAISPAVLSKGINTVDFLPNDFEQSAWVLEAKLIVWTEGVGKGRQSYIVRSREDDPAGFGGNILRASLGSETTLSLARAPDPIEITSPVNGVHYGGRALVQGEVNDLAHGGPTTIRVAGRQVGVHAGHFAAIVARPAGVASSDAWSIGVAADFPDGRRVEKSLSLHEQDSAASLSAPRTQLVRLTPDVRERTVFGAGFAKQGEGPSQTLEVTCGRELDATALTGALNNTSGACAFYRVEILDGAGDVELRLPATLEGLPSGFDPDETRVFALNEASDAWAITSDSFLDAGNKQTVKTLSDRSTAVLNGVLRAPDQAGDQPQSQSRDAVSAFVTSADPLQGKTRLRAPEPNPFGSAALSFPFMLRPARGGSPPRFGLSYDSSRGNGLAGDGWNLDVPIMTVDSKWGVPEYSDSRETETYLLDGRELVALKAEGYGETELPATYRNQPRSRGEYVFRPRRDEQFETVHRRGDGPANYWWEVVYKNGNREYYGGDPLTNGIVENSVRRRTGDQPGIHSWGLTLAIDPDGNAVRYAWNASGVCRDDSPTCDRSDDCVGLSGNCVTPLELSSVVYNTSTKAAVEGTPSEEAKTSVQFAWKPRGDRQINARYGVPVLQANRLSRVAISYGRASAKFADYELVYKDPEPATLYKSLLSRIDVTVPADIDCQPYDVAGEPVELNCETPKIGLHDNQQSISFEYFQDNPELKSTDGADHDLGSGTELGNVALLRELTGDALGSASTLGTNFSEDQGSSLYVGGSPFPSKQFSAGGKTGHTKRKTWTRSSLVDMTGDGIPDAVFDIGSKLRVCAGKRKSAVDINVVYPKEDCKEISLDSLKDPLGLEYMSSISKGGEAHLYPYVFFGGAQTTSTATRSTYLADVDGNGLMDVVHGGAPIFNNGQLQFSSKSDYVYLPAAGGAAGPSASPELTALYGRLRGRAEALEARFPPTDVVQVWRAPFSGVVALSGAILQTVKGPRPGTATRMIVERSRQQTVERCAVSDAVPAGGVTTWVNPVSSCGGNPADVTEAINELVGQIADATGLLFLYVRKGDVVYVRENGDARGRVDPGRADVTITYAALDDDPNRISFVSGVAQSGIWDTKQLSACLRSDSGGSVVPRCDEQGRSPFVFELAGDIVFSASPQDDLLISAQGEANFSGVLTFPAGRQPVHVWLLSTTVPAVSPPDLGQKIKDTRSLFDPSAALVLSQTWESLIGKSGIVIPGDCKSGPLPPVAGINVSCRADDVIVSFDHVELDLCANGGCIPSAGKPSPQTRVRLAVRPQLGPAPVGPSGLTPEELETYAAEAAVFELGDRVISYPEFRWLEAPRLRFATNTQRPADLASVEITDSATETAMEARADETQYVTPVYEDRYELTQKPGEIGFRTGAPYYQSIEIDEEIKYLEAKAEASGGEIYDNPVVREGGYRLPGDATKCSSSDELCEYRIAHVFFTDYPAFDDQALKSFNFDLRATIDGRAVTLTYLGYVDKAKCGENPIKGYPSEHLKRSTDCGLQDPSLITTDPKLPKKTVGIQFQLNDGNRVWGRESIYSFRAKPGDLLHLQSVVRPEWNPTIAVAGYISPSRGTPLNDRKRLGFCYARPAAPRDAQALLEIDHRQDPCRPWVQLRSSEVRLSFEAGLGLADEVTGRKDFARLFVPVSYEEQYHRVPTEYDDFNRMKERRSFPAITTDHRGWSRFAVGAPLSDTAPAYADVQFRPISGDNQAVHAGKAADAGVACTGTSSGDCDTKAGAASETALQGRVHALRPAFLDTEVGKAETGAAPAVAGFTDEGLRQGETCGGGAGVVRCYMGPDDDIWVALGEDSGRTEVAQFTGRLGPDDLAAPLASLGDAKPAAGVPAIPIPVLYTESESRSGRVSLLSSVISTSKTFTQYLDMNGDGYPDPIVEGTVGYTGPTGVPRKDWLPSTQHPTGQAHGRESQSRQQDLAYGIGNGGLTTALILGAPPGDGNLGQTVGQDTARGASTDGSGPSTGGQSSPDAPFGLGLSLNASYGAASSRADLLDINGDGLPDKVWLEDPSFLPGAGRIPSTLEFQLNLGYGFGTRSSWALPDTAGSVNASGGLGVNLGYNDGNGGWSGGVALLRTGSSSRNTLVDITGDGLADLVAPGDGEYRVYVNQGNGFAPEPVILKLGDWPFRDTTASETSVIDGGGTFVVAIPLCVISCYLIINPGMRREQAVGRNLVAMQDLNGDGLLDLATTPGFYQGYEGSTPKFGFPSDTSTKNYLNPLGKNNKLKTIHDAASGVTRLDYRLVGNEGEQNPKGIWALSRIDGDDGFYPTKRSDDGDDRLSVAIEYGNGRYDRHERAFLGFGSVTATYRGVDCPDGNPCPDASNQAVLKEVKRTYLNGSVYDMGLLASEEISDDPAESRRPRPVTVSRRDYAYDLWDLQDHPDPTRCGVSVAGKSQDEACLDEIDKARTTRTEQLTADVWNNPQRHLNPRLRAVRQVMTEASSNRALRSLLTFDYDESGNVATMVDFGQVRNSDETGDDSRDDYRADLAYASIPTAPALEAEKPADAVIRDRVKRIVVHRGLRPSPLPDDVLRLREAIYQPQTGHLRTLCQYPKLTARMEEIWTEPVAGAEGNEALCARLDRHLDTRLPPPVQSGLYPTQGWSELASVVGAYGLAPTDVVVNRFDAFDHFGNPHVTFSPFNANGDRIETYRCFDGDPFAQTPTASLQLHLRPNQDGLPLDWSKLTPKEQDWARFLPAAVCAAVKDQTLEVPSLAEFRWSADVEPRMGAVDKSVDINGNTTFTHRDNWSRIRTVLSDWGAPNSFSEHMGGPARAACAEFADRGAAVGSVDGRPECSVLLHVDYELTDFGEKGEGTAAGRLWSSVVQRYVLEDLYAGGSTQDDKAAIWQGTFVDPAGKAVQANKEATVCVEAADLHAGPRPTSGIPELCKRQAPGIASGWQAYDGLGRTTRSYYPQPITPPAGWTRPLDELVAVPHLPDLSGAISAAIQYDALDRVRDVILPDQNRLAYDFRLAPEPIVGLSRLRTLVLDSRCSAKALDRDARGLIGTVWEVQQKSFVKDSTLGGMTAGSDRAKERNTCLEMPVAEFEKWAEAPEASEAVADGVAATRYDYDQMGQLRTIARPLGSDTIQAEYDLLGRRIRLGDPDRGNEVLTYDPMGSVVERDQISIRAVEPRKIRYMYSANRLVGTRYDEAWQKLNVEYVYDDLPKDWAAWTSHEPLRRWLTEEAPDTCRNCRGRIVAIRDSTGLVVRQFDVFGQVTGSLRSIDFEGEEIGRFRLRNDYDTWGQLRAERFEDLQPEHASPSCFVAKNSSDYLCDHRHTIAYSYDQAEQVVGLQLDTRDVARVAYDAFGAKAARWTGDGTISLFSYDGIDRRLNAMSATLSSGEPISGVQYRYDAAGNLLAYVNRIGDPSSNGFLSSFSFEYDAAHRLTRGYEGIVQDNGMQLFPTRSTGSFEERYTYDLRHRMIGKGDNSYVYPPFVASSEWKPVNAPQSILAHEGAVSRIYDGWGALQSTLSQTQEQTTESRRLEWDPESRLVGIQKAIADGFVSSEYAYDHAGSRVVKREGVTARAPNGILHMYPSPFFSKRSSGTVVIHLTMGLERVASVVTSISSQKTYPVARYYVSELPNGSITLSTQQVRRGEHEGRLSNRSAYSPFGDTVVDKEYGARSAALEDIPQFGLSSKEHDEDTNYVYFGARYYDSSSATWLSPDPILTANLTSANISRNFPSAGLSSYSFSRNNPLSFLDYNGMEAEPSHDNQPIDKDAPLQGQVYTSWDLFDLAGVLALGRGLVRGAAIGIGRIFARSSVDEGVLTGARYAQITFSEFFSAQGKFAGKSIQDLSQALKLGKMTVDDIPVEYIVRDGNKLILNTRSAKALESAGIPRAQWKAINMTGDAAAEIRLTNQLQRSGLSSKGVTDPLPRGGKRQ